MYAGIMDLLTNAYTKSSIYISGKPIGKLDLHNENSSILIELLNGDSKRRGIILHPGTNTLLYLAVLLATYNVFFSEESDNTAFLRGIKEGDLVVYGDKRSKYHGMDKDGRIIIESAGRGSPLITYVPETLTYKLKPYYGSATTLDGRGIKRGSIVRHKFLANLFDLEMDQIKNTFNTSIVVVCDKTVADDLMESLRIGLDNRKTFSFAELFPAAYYTSSGEAIFYPGNPSKQDPLVKFTGKLSMARELIIEDRNIPILLINGSQHFIESTEFASIYARNSLKSIVMLGELAKSISSFTPEIYDNLEVYAWTKDVLINRIGDLSNSAIDLSDSSKQVYMMADNYVNSELHEFFLSNPIDSELYIKCKKLLLKLARSNVNQNTEQFLIKGFTLFNHFQRTIFPLGEMEKMISAREINAFAPSAVLCELVDICNRNLETMVAHDMLSVLSILAEMSKTFAIKNPKFEALKEIVASNRFNKKRIAVIVAKSYYTQIFMKSLPVSLIAIAKRIDFFTPSRFNLNNIYDEVIFFGVFDWKVLNPTCLSNTRIVRVILYENERYIYTRSCSINENNFKNIGNINKIAKPYVTKDSLQNEIAASNELEDLTIEDELEQIMSKTMKSSLNIHSIESNGKQVADIIRVALLESGEYVYFTRYYSAYIFDVERQTVVESGVMELKPGNVILFTNYGSETRDIVDRMMVRMIEENKCNEYFKACYRKSVHWKRILKAYMDNHRLSYKDLSDKMHEIGNAKHEATLRAWLDEDSHIIGPRDSESYYAIAILTNDSELMKDPDSFHEASKEVRSMRIRILRFIASQIIKTFGRSEIISDDLFIDQSDEIAKISMLVQIESITDVENLSVPTHMANRPTAN